MKNHEKKDWDKEQIISALVKMRVEKFATTKTMLDFLMKEIGYAQTYAYEMIKISKARINEIFKEEHEESFHNAIARLEEIIETTKNEKTRLEAQKEMNKLLGLHKPQKVDVTSGGKELSINEVVVKIIKSDDRDLDED
jgi:plasmid maintenance system antidote protein VapI